MEENKNNDIEAEENTQGDSNRNLITILITLVVLVVVAVIYWDRQNNRNFQQAQAAMQTGLLEKWGPQSQQQVNSALGLKPAAFSKQVSYRDIVAKVAPSVVSVKVGSSFINQGPIVQSQPLAWGKGNVSAGATAGYLRCPNCYTTVPSPGAGQVNMVNCPSCGMRMRRGSAQSQLQANPNQPADQSSDATGFGQYVWGGRMGGWGTGPIGLLICPNCSTHVPHQRGVAAYTINCPSCGTRMMPQSATGARPVPADTQQVANQLKEQP